MSIPTPRPLHPSLGAEICGLDLRETLSAEDRAAVAAALAEHIVLVFRDQTFTPAENIWRPVRSSASRWRSITASTTCRTSR